MSFTETYKTNANMRAAYFRMNGYTHAEISDATDCSDYIDENAYKIMLTDGDGVGTWEDREFTSIGAARKWCAEFAPELEVIWRMTMSNFEKALHLLLGDNRGVYIPQHFVEGFDWKAWGVKEEDAEILMKGPEHERYWEIWESVLDSATFTDIDGHVFRLYQDGDLWAYCSEIMPDQEYFDFFGETKDGDQENDDE